MAKLTGKQEMFVSEYLIDLNATQAAIRAGYSEKTASEMGYENLSKPQIAEAITEAKQKVAKRNEVTVDDIVKMHKAAFDMAEKVEQPSAMTTSAQNTAKLLGLIIDKSEIDHKGLVVTLESDANKL
tara:strand:+ start:20496 stop:20876 length:381 start_codon:yes stop_codon:yes gene_type:complete